MVYNAQFPHNSIKSKLSFSCDSIESPPAIFSFCNILKDSTTFHVLDILEEFTHGVIATFDFKRSKHYAEISKGVKMKFVDFPLPAIMDIFKHKLLIISWENLTGILISSKEIPEHFRNYFDSIWKLATR